MSTLQVNNITGLTDLSVGGVDIDAQAENAYNQANAAFVQANTALTTGQGAFAKANTALANTTTTLAGDLTVTGNVILSGVISANGSVGSADQVLTSNGSVAYWADPGIPTFTLVEDTNLSGTSSILTIASTAREMVIIVDADSASTSSNRYLRVSIGDSGGIETTGRITIDYAASGTALAGTALFYAHSADGITWYWGAAAGLEGLDGGNELMIATLSPGPITQVELSISASTMTGSWAILYR